MVCNAINIFYPKVKGYIKDIIALVAENVQSKKVLMIF
ncbi:Glycosyltransferase [Bacillus sp. IT-79MI2]|nr:hypothetical protein BTH41_00988 [Bacillus mycoides]